MDLTMNEIVIYGAGGLGRETALMIQQMNEVEKSWRLVGFFDDGIAKGTMVSGIPVMGGLSELNRLDQPYGLALAIADPLTRRRIVESVDNGLLSFPVLAHPTALMGSESNFFGRGTIIMAGCILTTNVVLGEFTIINLASTIGHDVRIGSFCSVMPGSHISGNVEIGEESLIGTGSSILQNITIGKGSKVGAGAVVTKDFPEGGTLVGVPAIYKK